MGKELFNKKNKEDLKLDLKNEDFNRVTISFYKYINLTNLEELRDQLYIKWRELNILGRVYIAEEGINAQLSVPEKKLNLFINEIKLHKKLKDINIKQAIIEGDSFYKLIIKIKKEIVAYKVSKNQYDMNTVGKHLNYKEFNNAIDSGATVIDVRNYYEGEVGKFENAIIPDIDRSEDLLPEIKKLLKGQEENKILMYCTGGIRCEKASSFLIKQGFNDVNQLDGGIIKYANDIKKDGVESKFIGKNFVFDSRLGEKITDDIISSCHQCNNASNDHTNCENSACHILFIQCDTCRKKYLGCCSNKCLGFIKLNDDEKKDLISKNIIFNGTNSDRLRPKLRDLASD
tara:strand:- start:104 stop:1138 length:1035 start_codon:yes stop_codon:yes gene_type:complete